MLKGYDDHTDICLTFRTVGEIDYDFCDQAQQRRISTTISTGLVGKCLPCSHVDDSDDFHFNRANQIRMPSWGR